MDNNIYIALSRQASLFRAMDVTAGNIANINTTGYNAEQMMFKDYMVADADHRKNSFVQDISTYRALKAGPMRATGNALDLAIEGRGYFVVETPLGERYTRAGNFQLDGEGTLVTPQGYPVLDNNGQRIQFDEEDAEIIVGEAGNVSVKRAGEANAPPEERAQLGIVQFENEYTMERMGNGLYKSDEEPEEAENIRVQHGVLEGSNVEGVVEVTRMIQISRSVASTAKFIETMYDLERRTSNTYAKQS